MPFVIRFGINSWNLTYIVDGHLPQSIDVTQSLGRCTVPKTGSKLIKN
jgi:hypothetical protein